MERGDALRIAGDLLQPSVGNNITVPSGLGIAVGGNVVGTIGSDYGAFRGNVVQCRVTRYETQITGTSGTSTDGVELTGMRVSITPKFSNSMIVCQFQIHLEISTGEHNMLFNVYKNGAVPTGTYAGFNNVAGNNIWSGIAMCVKYDSAQNSDSTPDTTLFTYHDFPGTTNTLTYAPGIKSSDTGNRTFYINRTVASTGQNGYEIGTSYSIVWEIAQ